MSERQWHVEFTTTVIVEAPDRDTAWRIAGEMVRQANEPWPRIRANTRTYRPSSINEDMSTRTPLRGKEMTHE